MKICMFTNTYHPHVGGVARSVGFFAEDLRAAGHTVLVIAPTFSGHAAHDRTEPDIFRVPAIQQFNGSDFSVRIPSPFLIDERLDELRPDIIHSHHPYLLGDAALRAARRRSLPLVFTHHTRYEEYTHYLSSNPENMKRFAAFLSTNYANLCDRVIAPSQSIEHLIMERGVETPVAEIPTGVDVPVFANGDAMRLRKEFSIPADAFVIGHLGRLAPEKNLAFLADAVSRTLQKQPQSWFLVAGEGPSEADIRAVFERDGVAGRLVRVGTVSGQRLVDAYHAMDVFAFASKSETQGMVLTEAMAAGVPAVALDASGAREVVRDAVNGRLLDGDATAARFADALQAVMASPGDQRRQWQANARETADAFSRLRSAEKLQALYAEAIDSRINAGDYKTATLDIWEKFLQACQAEWDLVTEKTESIIQAMDDELDVTGLEDVP